MLVLTLTSSHGDAEIKVPAVETPPHPPPPPFTPLLPLLKPGVGQKIALRISPTARNFFLVLSATFLVHSPSVSQILSLLPPPQMFPSPLN